MCTSSDERVRLAEQRAGRRGDERARPTSTSRSRPTVRALRAVYMSVTDAEQAEQVAVGHAERRARTCAARRSARSAASSRVHGVVSVSSTTSEIDVATRVTISPAEVRPWAVRPTSCPNQVPSGTTMSPGVMKLSVAGSTTMPVKIGTNSHTRLTKNDERQRARRRRAPSVDDVQPDQHRDVRARATAATSSPSSAQQLDPRVDALQQAGLRGDVVGEHRLAQQAGAAVDRLLDEAALAALADAAARAQADLGLEQPAAA